MPDRDRLDYLSERWSRRRPEIDIRPWRVWGRITRIHELFLQAVAPALARHDLTFKEYQTLGALVLAGPPYEASPGEIARFNLLTSGGLANLLGRMEKEGLIERHRDLHDRRGVVVRLTERGRGLFDEAILEENAKEHALLKTLSAEERAVLALLLRKLLVSIDENFPSPIQPTSNAAEIQELPLTDDT